MKTLNAENLFPIGSKVRFFDSSYPNLDELLDELKAAGVDTSQLNLVETNE